MQHTHRFTLEPRNTNTRKVIVESFPAPEADPEEFLLEHQELLTREKSRLGKGGIITGSFTRIVTEFFVEEAPEGGFNKSDG